MKRTFITLVTLCVMLLNVFAQSPSSEPACLPPSNLAVDHIMGTSALVSWTPTSSLLNHGNYYVEYAEQGSSDWLMESTMENRVMLAGLQALTTYDVRLYMDCGEGYTDTLTTSFTTQCLAGGPFAIGGGTEQEENLPDNAFWNYSLTQQIFSASEMNGAATLESISFDCISAFSTARNISVYLMHTTQTNPTDWLPMQNAQLVYSGSTIFSSGWNTLMFTSPFAYNGTDHLAVIILDQTGYYSSKNYFYAHQSSNTTLYFFSDDVNPATSLPHNDIHSTFSRLNTKFGAPCNNTATCVAPNAIVSDIAATSVTIAWAPGSNETAWNIDYRLMTESEWTSVGTATETSFIIEDLQPTSSYVIRITSDCGGEEVSTATLLNVTTSCIGITSLPFTENFDELTATENIPSCWNSRTNRDFVTPAAGYLNHSAPNGMTFDGDASHYVYLTMPRLADDFEISNLLVTFYAMRLGNSSPSFELGVMNDPLDYNTFTPISQVYPSEIGSWMYMEVGTASYMGTGRYLAFRSNCYIHIDDITVSQAPTCFHVSHVTVDNITSSTADVHWQNGAYETAWDVAYGIHGTVNPDEILYQTVYDENTFTLTDLTPNSNYDVFVRANCGLYQSEWMSTSFWSGCDRVENLPLNENFDQVTGSYAYAQTNNLPNCWSYLNTGTEDEYLPIVVDAPDYAASGANSVYFFTMDEDDYGDQYAILPEINVQTNPLNGLSLSFDARTTYYGDFHLAVGVMTDPTDASTFTPVDTIVADSTLYQNFTVDFTSYAGEGSFIALKAYKTQDYNGGYVDNVNLDHLTDCARPSMLQVTNLMSGDLSVTWSVMDPNQTLWEVAYGPRGFVIGVDEGYSETVYNTPETTIAGLEDGIYDFYVRSQCDESGWSNWCGPVAGCPNAYVMTQNASDTLSTCSMYVFDNGGVSGSYANGSNDILVLYPDQEGMVSRISGLFNLERYSGVLSIYDGVGMTGELLWISTSAEANVGTLDVTSSTGPLTIQFTSNDYSAYSGYELFVTCEVSMTCARPSNVAVSQVAADEVTLDWNSFFQESQWVVEYGEAGFEPGQGTQMTTSNHPYSIQNLTPNTTYDFYVRALCSSTDTSEYSFAATAATSQVVAQTPYYTDFSDVQENAMWTLVNGNQPNQWYIGQPTGHTDNVMFVSNNGQTAEYAFDESSVVWAYRDIQFTSGVPEFELSFSWKGEGERLYGLDYDFIKVYVADSTEVAAGVYDESALLPLSEKLNRQSSWQHFSTLLDSSYAGQTKRIYFVWKNDNRDGNNPSAMIDSIRIRELMCVSPKNLYLSSVTDQSADITFNAPTNTSQWQYVISYEPINPDLYSPVDVTTSLFTVGNLYPETTYYLYMRTICSATEHSVWTGPLTFTTDTLVPVCYMPTGLSVASVTHNTALVTWYPGGMENAWNVQYRESSASAWNDVLAYTTSVTLTDLEENTEYQVRIQAACEGDMRSDWTSPINFTTTPDGVNEYVMDEAVSLYPNPTNNQCTIHHAQSIIHSVSLYDVYGKLLYAVSVNDSNATLDLSQYADGVYFVRVATDNGVVTKRVVKK